VRGEDIAWPDPGWPRRGEVVHARAMRDVATVQRGVSYEAYLALEASSVLRHEWFDGVVYDMAGGTLDHSALCASVITALSVGLAGKPCRVFTSDARVRVRATGLATYPDAAVACGRIERDPDDANALANPLVLVEVLSDSTEDWDRGGKFAHYRRIPALRDYVIVSQRERLIEHHSRNEDGTWTMREHGPGETVTLRGVSAQLAVDAVYRDPMAG
jgi:Uma2 family endonuclease